MPSTPQRIAPSLAPDEDLTLLFAVAAAVTSDKVQRHIAEAGFPDVRHNHGYVFQHLIPGPVSVSELATKLGVTAQGASKSVAELEQLGYVRRRADPDDQRTRIVELTERGWAVIEAGRAARVAVNRELRALLGERATNALVRTLQRIGHETGGFEALLARRLRPLR